ncbi:unnamed protein product [Caenorhabditis auriculariae]|uniref:Uncharacterized protein n=1 Tax=Caenorhabditis auriculariae TaxID=2777116 RepID=A0A8S1H5G3_9PELO|nr:unnamed protein product [Caenorhabditis auriculariae]
MSYSENGKGGAGGGDSSKTRELPYKDGEAEDECGQPKLAARRESRSTTVACVLSHASRSLILMPADTNKGV